MLKAKLSGNTKIIYKKRLIVKGKTNKIEENMVCIIKMEQYRDYDKH